MSGIIFALTALVAGYLADIVAERWGFRGEQARPARQFRASMNRNMSSRPNGQPISFAVSSRRKTGIRSA